MLRILSTQQVSAHYLVGDPAAQIDALIALLQGSVARHGIRPDRIVGHNDIAPRRKDDPGPAFPWRRAAARQGGRAV